jgi:hydrogenase maturation protein HypF
MEAHLHGSRHQLVRRRFDLRGQVQGVGFRPFVYRLAVEFHLAGYVANNSNGAVIEIEGPTSNAESFEAALLRRLPPLARISDLRRREIPPLDESSFRIELSERGADKRPEVTPDAATCQDCLTELFDANDRRYRYPFINCTNCGPRYSIVCTVPYDRPATTMAGFVMCEPCQREYTDPADRRFHAQPNACPVCGPQLRLHPADAQVSGAADAIKHAASMLSEGKVVAVKGIGGYHLACRADRQDVVMRLRERKLRDGKPLAVMVPNVETARRVCRLTPEDIETLASSAAPIVLVPKNANHGLAGAVAPNCGDFGIMLPYAPVHHLLFAEGLGPLVMTSANLAGQPLTYEDADAVDTLSDVAEAFLMHDRPIFRPIDDSVVFTFRGEAVPIRRARGYAPRPIPLATRLRRSRNGGPKILAVGGELKSTVCLYAGGEATLSEHLGDLTNPDAFRNFVRAIERLKGLFEFVPQAVAHDLHPQYLSTQYARRLDIPAVAVQHHHAHIVSVMAEWGEPGPVIGVACDGVGYGTDGAVWGCEVLRCTPRDFERLGHLEYYAQVGGDAAAIETWRPAATLLRQALGETWREALLALISARPHTLTADALEKFEQQAAAGINAPPSSSLGRVFDAVSFLLGLCDRNRHEAEAAIALEGAAGQETVTPYAYKVAEAAGRVAMSLSPTLAEICAALRAGESVSRIAARFHESVAHMLADAATVACEMSSVQTVGLSGGCFANRWLLGRLVELLEGRRLRVLYHRQIPCGDGGLALGQAVVAAWRTATHELNLEKSE